MTAYLSIQQAADEVGSHPWTIWRACVLGVIPSIRIGVKPNTGPYRIPVDAWERFKNSRLVSPPTPVSVAGEPLVDQVMRRGR